MISAVDIGGTKTAVGEVSGGGKVVARLEVETEPEKGFAYAMEQIRNMLCANVRSTETRISKQLPARAGRENRVDNGYLWRRQRAVVSIPFQSCTGPSRILCSGIMGGAIVPAIIGRLGDHFGLRAGMTVLYLTFGCVLSVGFWAQPLVNNVTLRTAKQSAIRSAASELLRRGQ